MLQNGEYFSVGILVCNIQCSFFRELQIRIQHRRRREMQTIDEGKVPRTAPELNKIVILLSAPFSVFSRRLSFQCSNLTVWTEMYYRVSLQSTQNVSESLFKYNSLRDTQKNISSRFAITRMSK